MNATKISRDSVHLIWTLPRGQYDVFEVEYLNTDVSTMNGISSSSDGGEGLLVQNLTDKPWFLVQGLRPYRNYTFTVVVRAGGVGNYGSQHKLLNGGSYSTEILLRRSVPVSGTFSTLEWVPGRCKRFQAVDVQPGQITLEWTLPESEHNGVLLHYVVSWTAVLTSSISSSAYGTSMSTNAVADLHNVEDKQLSINNLLSNDELLNGRPSIESEIEIDETIKTAFYESWRNKATIKGLIPGYLYVFNISGETRIGRGAVVSLEQRMPILGNIVISNMFIDYYILILNIYIIAPPKPNAQVVPTEVSRTTNSIQVRFRKNYFGNQNGRVIAYTLIVAEDDSKNSTGLEMPSWKDVQAYTIWPPYQVN